MPAGSVEAYKNSWPWSDFKEIVPLTGDDLNPGRKRTIHVAQAGTLSDYIIKDDRHLIEELTLTGEINGVDFGLLRNMAGKSYEFVIRDNRFYGSDTGGKLSVLDLSGVKIVAGGDYMEWEHSIEENYFYYLSHDDEIPRCVFCGCIGLTSIIFPNSVTIIGDNTFYECTGLRMIKLGSGVKEIKYDAFNCDNLATVISKIETPFAINGKSSSGPVFSTNTFMNADLFVPVGTIDKYKATQGWKDFVWITEGIPSGIGEVKTEVGKTEVSRYTLDGKKMSEPQEGINIIKMSDGTTKKVIVK